MARLHARSIALSHFLCWKYARRFRSPRINDHLNKYFFIRFVCFRGESNSQSN